MLCDSGGKAVEAYGVRNSFTALTTILPHAAVIVIDAEGLIRFKSVDRNYKKRTTMRTILQTVREVQGGGNQSEIAPPMNADERV